MIMCYPKWLSVSGEGADMVERTGEGRQPIARNPPVGGGDAHHPAEGSRLADGASGIGAERHHGGALRHGGGRSAARSAGNAIGRHGIPHRPECRVFGGRTHGELIAVGLADDQAAGLFHADHRGGVVGRDVIGQHFGAAGGADTLGDDDVLDGDGDAGQGTRLLAAGDLPVHAARVFERPFGREMQVGIGDRIRGFGEAERFGGQVGGAEAVGEQALPHGVDGQRRNVHGLEIHGLNAHGSAFDNPGHLEIASAGLRRAGQGGLVAQRRPRRVGPQGGRFPGVEKHLRHGLHAGGIDLFQLVHVLQNAVEVGLQFHHFRAGELQVGQVGYVANFLFGNFHASAFLREAR